MRTAKRKAYSQEHSGVFDGCQQMYDFMFQVLALLLFVLLVILLLQAAKPYEYSLLLHEPRI